MKRGARTVTRGKKAAGFRWWTDRTLLWILGGFGVVYLALIPLDYHPYHWLFSVVGGVATYPLGLFCDNRLASRAIRFARRGLLAVSAQPGKEERARGRR